MRELLNLLEEKKQLEQIKLSYTHNSLSPVMSSMTVDYHYGKLYKAYVDKYNKGEGDKSFNEAGAYLHGIFFSQFKNPGSQKPSGNILSLIERHHSTFVDFKKAFKEEAMKIQGSGWCYLSKSGQIKTIKNHAMRTDIALLVDMWEHAYNMDYSNKKDKYLDNIWRIIDWNAVNKRL